MRIVAVADTHMFHRDLVVPDGDVFVHAGDMCRSGDRAELMRAAEWIRALPHRVKIVVAGNHDWYFADEPEAARRLLGEEIVFLHDSAATIEGVRFWGSPWQPEFNAWAFNLPRGEALAEKWALIPEDTDVLVTHGPPMGIGDRSSVGGRQGCADLLARVRAIRPRVHLFGHIHEDGGAWSEGGTLFMNVTTWECERLATIVDFDPETKAVTSTFVPSRRP